MMWRVRIQAIGLTLLLSLSVADCAKADYKSNLTVEIDGLKNQKGELCYKLFSASPGFPNSNESAVKRECAKITDTPLKLTLKNLASGSYAIAVYHDTNGDRVLNRNATGMPTEGYGFSNNPVIRQGPPKYGDCVFLLAGPSNTLKIQMKYP